MLKKSPFLPTQTQRAKTRLFPKQRSRIVQILNVPHMGDELFGSSGLGG
jgi:hypothetical protein